MAAPTSVRVEATSITSTVIRWSYSGSNQIAVYRSTDGSSYSEVTSAGSRVAVGTTSYTDTGLSTATKYWYKLSDDAGSTFSSVVTVWTHTCGVPPSQDSDAVLPRAGDEVTPEVFNDLAIRVETGLTRFTDPQGRTCVACISDGALVLDCITYAQCEHIEVEVDADVNSISMPNCENDIKTIDFIIPPNTTRRICGWPGGFGFTGDECQQAPITAGAAGKTMSVPTGKGKAEKSQSKTGVPTGGAGSGGGTGSGCTCVPNGNGQLTIKSCNANNSLGCSGSKSLRLIACGGRGPYTWSKTGSVVLSKSSGTSTTVTPPANTGSAVAGTAYWVDCYRCQTCSGGTCSTKQVALGGEYNCNDEWISNQGTPCSRVSTCSTSITDGALSKCCNNNTAVCPSGISMGCVDVRSNCPSGVTQMCDQRTAGMISNGCNPCGLQAGATVTVTDALGTQTTIVLTA